ncbi:MAG TPA: right-handed parallel beta-helix repeat-containing protein [Phycisphaerales bacterium]|nr:right-handed parallel beta-helix repeat-containing protein [Phycisphaerales bacterium]
MIMLTHTLALALSAGSAASFPPPPEVVVTADNTAITSSCRVVIPAGAILADSDGNGVIQIKGDNITVEFADGSILRGAAEGADADGFTGKGVVIEGGRRIVLKGAKVQGYKVGIHAIKSNSLTIEGADISGNFRQHLRSTPLAEDSADWLFPHKNDSGEWAANYGAGLLVEQSNQVTITGVLCRRGQNGIMLDRVNDSRIYANDCSFISGWGLAMWRSSKNLVSRNAFDFCVRGHVEGVYNRGQDSAGILMFEQCSNNVFVENSVTHGGDGVFGFAGHEAIGETPAPQGFVYGRKGCNDNLFIRNDLSYASAHGLEMTFSHGNMIIENRFNENAICGIWGGYSQDSIIARNTFSGNGGMAYGLERGAINMEHASGNRIVENTFINNKVAVHLWWDDDKALLEKPGVKKSYKGVSNNIIAENTVKFDDNNPFKNAPADAKYFAWQFRDAAAPPDASQGKERTARQKKDEHFKKNQVSQNVTSSTHPAYTPAAYDPGTEPETEGPTPSYRLPKFEVLGKDNPVGARSALAGRDKIIMDEWGPWDHQSPLIRAAQSRGSSHVYEIMGAGSPRVSVETDSKEVQVSADPQLSSGRGRITVSGGRGVQPYSIKVKIGDDFSRTLTGTLMPARWTVAFFTWTDSSDPRKDLKAWRALADSTKARTVINGELALKFAHGGPNDMKFGRGFEGAGIAADRFGTIATTRFQLPAGTWKFSTLSDDGVRLIVDGKTLIENWDWHAPERDSAELVMTEEKIIEVTLEHFEIDGFSTLEFGLEKVK